MEKIESLAVTLVSCVFNSRDMNELLALLLKEHRTCQQRVMKFCIAYIEKMAENGSDLRNEAAVGFARKVVMHTTAKDRSMPMV